MQMQVPASDAVFGLGSPHGDDAVAWLVVERLRTQAPANFRITAVDDPLQIVAQLDHCRQLTVIDACQGAGPPGSITRLRWPDARLAAYRRSSTHAVSLADALHLADALGKLPDCVVIYGIEIGSSLSSADGISGELAAALPQIERFIADDLVGCDGESAARD